MNNSSLNLKSGQIIGSRYELVSLCGAGAMSEVWQAKDIDSDVQIAIKFLKPGTTSSYIDDVIRFKREVEAASKLDHPNIIKVYASGEYQGTPYIVTELLAGKNLSASLAQKFSVDETVGIIYQLAQALDHAHAKGIIHRDLKPDNIMINENNEIKLLDFGLAHIMELRHIKEKDEIVGTFGFMSPEAAGIVRKSVDERSDLYSLGIIFYQLLTSRLPFEATEVGKLLHQQAAKLPTRPIEIDSKIDRALDEMVTKLLAKEPDLRYQSARGFLYDLERYRKGERDFSVGSRDQKAKLTYQTRIIGRDEELKQLRSLFAQAQAGKGNICLIAGEPGIGKSRLAEEVRTHCYQQDGLFFTGRCYDHENKTPYQPFRETIDEYIAQLNRLNPQDREQEVSRIKEKLGTLAKVIAQLNANMAPVLGVIPDLVSLDSDRENRRFLMVASDFFCCLTKQNRPCVLFIDDLQWADEGTLSLLEEISEKVNNSNLMIIGTYRDGEVGQDHSLTRIINKAKKAGYALSQIALGCFNQDKLRVMVAQLLGDIEERAQVLAEYVLSKSGGNPFFAINIVRDMVQEKAIEWTGKNWEADWKKIAYLPIASTMVEVILKRLKELAPEQEKLLCTAAVVGREFELDLLYDLIEVDQETIVRLVDDAKTKQLLEESLERGKILFAHDRIRDAFYQKLNPQELIAIHLKIATTMEEKNKDNLEAVLFDLAHHYTEGENKEKSLEYAFPAAQQAQARYANEEGISYYTIVLGLLEEKGQQANPQWLKAKEGLADVYLTAGKANQSIATAQELLSYMAKPLDKARIYSRISKAHFELGNLQLCEDNAAKGLRLLGERLPRKMGQVILVILRESIIYLIYKLFPFSLPCRNKDKIKGILSFYQTLNWYYALNNLFKFTAAAYRALNISQKKMGKSYELGIAIGYYASLFAALGWPRKGIFERSIAMLQEVENKWGVAQVKQWQGAFYCWYALFEEGIKIMEESEEGFRKIGDIWQIAMVMHVLGDPYYWMGDYQKGIYYYQQYMDLSRKINDNHGISAAQDHISPCYIEQGDFDKADELLKSALAISGPANDRFIICAANSHYGLLEIERGNHRQAIEYLLIAKKLYEHNLLLRAYTAFVYPYLTEAYLEDFYSSCQELAPREKRKAIKRISYISWRGLLATCLSSIHYGSGLRVRARYFALINKTKKAQGLFLKSIAHNNKVKRRFEQAKSHYDYGKFLTERNRAQEAKEQWQEAYNIFKVIGAKVYAQRCADLLGYKPCITSTIFSGQRQLFLPVSYVN